ncbi:MAG: hypothetical protein Q9216_003150 [Gyalolechia sp. 2 TL-2023]
MHPSLILTAFAATASLASPLTSRQTCAAPPSADLAAAQKAIFDAKLVPDLISSFSPSLLLRAAYNGKAVTLGNTFTTPQTLTQPTFSITKEAKFDPATTKYTVLLLDPDVPSPNLPLDRILLGNFVHIIVSDVQPECIPTQQRVILANYKPLTPASIAPHRYTFLVYRQPANFKPNLIQAQNFLGQPLSTFVASSGLQGPVGANFLHANMYSIIRVLGASLLIACASSQTPPGTTPATNNPLSVNYGSTAVTPGIRLERMQTLTIPTFNYRAASSSEQLYNLLFVDLSIPSSRVDPSELDPAQLPLATGLGANRTTRLHFWQAGLTFSDNGTLVNTTEPVAFYNGPMPPAGDIPHDYVFYLFQQEDGFAPPPEDSPFNVNNVNAESMNRMSFDVQRFADGEGVGDLVAANYIQVQNPASGGSGNGTAGPSATSPTTSATGGVTTPSPSPFISSAGKLGVRGVLGSIVLGSIAVLLV